MEEKLQIPIPGWIKRVESNPPVDLIIGCDESDDETQR